MEESITYQILRINTNDSVKQGNIITVNVQSIMAHDGTGPVVVETLRKNDITNLQACENAAFIFDHYFPAKTEREALLQKIAREFARDNNIKFYEGEGISHHIMPEKGLLKPGTILVGSDSHTCTGGAFGIYATGLGASDVAGVLKTGKLWLEVPSVIRIRLDNQLSNDVTVYDLALEIVYQVGFNGALGKSIEYFGSAIEHLSMEDRMRIANFSVEMGAVAGIFEIDDQCIKWYEKFGNPYDGPKIQNTSMDSDLIIDLSKVRERIAEPSKPNNSKFGEDIEQVKVDQVFIGSCSGGFYSDIKLAANILKGKRKCSHVRLLVCPATKTVLEQCMREGYIDELIAAGAVILPVGCGSCLGNIGALAEGEVAVSTQNRNFIGRVGSKKAHIYLASAKQAAMIALLGYVGRKSI